MKSIFAIFAVLVCASLASAQQPQGGTPVYAPRTSYEEVGRLYPAPYVVPTVWAHYHYRPHQLGRAIYGPWKVRYSPGPPMLYVPAN
jgi:hypothetical protein